MIEILNLRPGDLVTYPIVVLFGRCLTSVDTNTTSSQHVLVANGTRDETIKWSIKNSYFKVNYHYFKVCIFLS